MPCLVAIVVPSPVIRARACMHAHTSAHTHTGATSELHADERAKTGVHCERRTRFWCAPVLVAGRRSNKRRCQLQTTTMHRWYLPCAPFTRAQLQYCCCCHSRSKFCVVECEVYEQHHAIHNKAPIVRDDMTESKASGVRGSRSFGTVCVPALAAASNPPPPPPPPSPPPPPLSPSWPWIARCADAI